jgi:hypothetical protein
VRVGDEVCGEDRFCELSEVLGILVNDGTHADKPATVWSVRCTLVERRDDRRELVDCLRAQLTPICDLIKRRVAWESTHLQEPFDGFALAVEGKLAVRVAGDGEYPKVEIGSGASIEDELGSKRPFTAIEGAEVQEAEAHGAFHLVGRLAREEHDCGMGVDSRDRTLEGHVNQEPDGLLLRFDHRTKPPGRSRG